jgi:hypothetical protein
MVARNLKPTERPPFEPRSTIVEKACLDWLLELVEKPKGDGVSFEFSIDRTSEECKTPRRNEQVEKFLSNSTQLRQFFSCVHDKLIDTSSMLGAHGGFEAKTPLFDPVLAMFCFEEGKDDAVYIASNDMSLFIDEMIRKGAARATELETLFLARSKAIMDESNAASPSAPVAAPSLLAKKECELLVFCLNGKGILESAAECVGYIEDMLYNQLVSAIGKNLSAEDFSDYMLYHNRKLFKEPFRPSAFCRAVRRPGYSPEGTVEIQLGPKGRPFHTTTRSKEAQYPMYFDLSSAARVSFCGERFFHTAVLHKFSFQGNESLNLVANARQFSSFVLLVGTIASAEEFVPKAALIIKDKDELRMPLDLETIPTAKEFKDALKSLSPEQQEFCKAYRGLQLSSTLFGVLVVQIKPQLEKVLNLPADALTKEIQLTQDLMDLFITYQIPADLISYNGDPTEGVISRLSFIREHVSSIKTMLKEAKLREVEEAELQRKLERAHELEDEEEGSLDRLYRAPPPAMNMAVSGFGGGGMLAKRSSKSRSRGGGSQTNMQYAAPPPPAPAAPAKSLAVAGLVAEFSIADAQGATPGATTSAQQLRGESQTDAGKLFNSDWIDDPSSLPNLLDSRSEQFDSDAKLRPTIIKPGSRWRKSEKKGLLSAPEERELFTTEQETEKRRAFDLLDALTRSGAMPCDDVELHILSVCTHDFDNTLYNILLQENVNPIAKLERSSLIVASTLHSKPASELVHEKELPHLRDHCPPGLLEG